MKQLLRCVLMLGSMVSAHALESTNLDGEHVQGSSGGDATVRDPNAYPYRHPSKLQVLAWLQNKDYARLNAFLAELQGDYEMGAGDEMLVRHAFLAFANADPALESMLLDWNARYPSHFAPPLALAYYYEHFGWLARGSQWASKTPERQFLSMHEYFAKARKMITVALQRNAKLIVAYERLLRMDNAEGESASLLANLKQALEVDSHSYLPHYQYVFSRMPKWGGSMREVEQYLVFLEELMASNQRLASLRGFADFVRADRIRSKKRCREAIAYLDKALSKGEHHIFYLERAYKHACLRDYDAAIRDLDSSLELNPENARRLALKGQYLYRLKNYDAALQVLNEAIGYDRMSRRALTTRGRVYYELKKYDLAIADLHDAIAYDDTNAVSRSYLGSVYYSKKDYQSAIEHYEIALALRQDGLNDRYWLAAARWHLNDCVFMSDARSYLAQCESEGSCSKKRLDWMSGSLSALESRGVCSGKN